MADDQSPPFRIPHPGCLAIPAGLLILLAAGLTVWHYNPPAAGTSVSTVFGGRRITVTSTVLPISFSSDNATTLFAGVGGEQFAVETDRVAVNGREIARLPQGTAAVEIVYIDGDVTVKADGQPVTSSSAPP